MIIEQLQQILSSGKGMTISEITDKIPESVDNISSSELSYLLLRLDKRFEEQDGKWYLKVIEKKSDDNVFKAVTEYFKYHPRGELLEHLVKEVIKATGESSTYIKDVINKRFVIVNGKMVLNKIKE
jgi:hypothetical protein